MMTGVVATSLKVGVTFSNCLRHVESMCLHPSGAGRISHLNAVILGKSLESEENDLVFPSQEFSSQALVSSPEQLCAASARTKNYSGAELEGVVRSVVSYALNRQISFDDLTKPLDEESIKVTMDDFLNALYEVGPAFCASMDDLERRRLNGIIDYGESHKCIQERALLLVEQIKDNQSPLVTYLLEGPIDSGKTSMAATIGIESDFPYVKIVSCDIIDERKIITSDLAPAKLLWPSLYSVPLPSLDLNQHYCRLCPSAGGRVRLCPRTDLPISGYSGAGSAEFFLCSSLKKRVDWGVYCFGNPQLQPRSSQGYCCGSSADHPDLGES
ncbi:hypothetical protein ZIOFF_031861 [Zingiber officinale]|uniref:Vesicle-fusing ATPase n=1 Tax=Zingiber officinale TaxID=94328 RepID=A0A8J5GFI1_ZINOF|nr:hypothetical protein ZIOFF_031861 [Zingiber officinale]